MAAETRTNTSEGTNGTSVSTSNTSGPNQFNSVNVSGTGAAVKFSSTRAHTGSTSIQQTLPASVASTAYYSWTSLSADAQKFLRVYVWVDAYPTVATRLLAFIGAASLRASLQVTTTGTIRTVDSAGSIIATTAGTMPTGAWCRIEFEVTGISGTTGTVAARMYSGSNLEGWTPDSNGSLLNTGRTVGGTISEVRIGQSSTVTMTSTWSPYYDDIAENNQSQPGPLNGVYMVVVADMQPATGGNVPPQVVSAQVRGLTPTPNVILMPGDITNDGDQNGTSGEYGLWNTYYGNALGQVIYTVPGNHDWGDVVGSGSLTNYDTEFGTGGGSGTTPPHFISFDTSNGWHILGFDSDEQWVGSLNNSSATYTAVVNDLAANSGKPIIAFWHHPRFSDGINATDPGGTEDTTVVKDIWNLLRDYHADIVFNGHVHSYQRFPKLGKTGYPDAAGIREFVVGTGGSALHTLSSTSRSEVNSYKSSAYDQVNSKWFGYLKLWLTPTTYSWQFISQNAVGSENPGAVLDSGGPVQTNVSTTVTNSGLLMDTVL